jgi:hypothetical protein
MPAPYSHKARAPEPAAKIPLPRWCQPAPVKRKRYKLESVPHTGNDLPYYAHRRDSKEARHAL